MATTTPNFGWPVPTSTDLVKDGATAIEALGDGIDASLLDLKGGTTGQVLAKASNTDLDYSWVTTDDANAIQNSIVDAKGDLIGATANDTPARLAVGNNGETLIADSTAATGLKWAKSANFVGCSLFNSAAGQTIATSTLTAVTFDSENLDSDAFHSTSTNTSRITIPTGLGGKYQFTLSMLWASSAVGNRYFQLYKNGAAVYYGADLIGSASYAVGYNYTYTLSAAAGDYFEMYVFQASGGNLTLYNRSSENPFSCVYLGA
jgi:hypothetical protein